MSHVLNLCRDWKFSKHQIFHQSLGFIKKNKKYSKLRAALGLVSRVCIELVKWSLECIRVYTATLSQPQSVRLDKKIHQIKTNLRVHTFPFTWEPYTTENTSRRHRAALLLVQNAILWGQMSFTALYVKVYHTARWSAFVHTHKILRYLWTQSSLSHILHSFLHPCKVDLGPEGLFIFVQAII